MKTTLNKLKAAGACAERYKVLLSALGKTEADDEPLYIAKIVETNGIEDAVWALRTVDWHDREIRHFAADCAEMVLPIYEKRYPDDDRPRKAIQAARDYADGKIDDAARSAAWDAAWDASWDAAWDAAGSAARSAAWSAAWDAAGSAARSAAWSAARSAAWSAARSVALSAARSAAWSNIETLLKKYL